MQITGESAWHGLPWSRCTTNDSGSFRITGMPANVVTLGVLDRDGTLIREFRVSPGVTPVNLDL